MGFWAALRDVFPQTLWQRDWVHKTSNVLDTLPKSVHRRAKKAIYEITEAENKAVERFAGEFGAKWPRALAKITDEKEMLLAFYGIPPSTGVTSAPPTRSNPRLHRCGRGPT